MIPLSLRRLKIITEVFLIYVIMLVCVKNFIHKDS